VGDVTKRMVYAFIWPAFTGSWGPTPRGNFLFLFKKKTSQKSASLEPWLISSVGVWKLWSKSNKLYNISPGNSLTFCLLILWILGHNLLTPNARKLYKGSTDTDFRLKKLSFGLGSRGR